MVEQAHVDWCRRLFDTIKLDGVWGLPRTGLIFRKTSDTTFTLIDTLDGSPVDRLDERQAGEYESLKVHFGLAGITVNKRVAVKLTVSGDPIIDLDPQAGKTGGV